MKKTLTILSLAVLALVGLSACATPAAAPSISVAPDTVIVDVRTAAEYTGGHLQDAINIDVQSADFDALISALPTEGDYIIYCASGNRSAVAVQRMTDLGFTSLTDAGGVTDAATATGLAVVVD